jgi:RNase P subunit RPR2
MKIIKRGKGSLTDKAARFTCNECGSLIEAKKSEGKFEGEQKDGFYYVMRCPNCKKINHVASELFQL